MAVVSSLRSVTMIAVAAFLLFAMPLAIALPSYTNNFSLPPGTGGPESIAFDRLGGGPYTGISDGRIVKHVPLRGFIDFAYTAQTRNKTFCDGRNATADATVGLICGRPVGIAFNSTGFLFICDAYLGLYVVGPSGGRATRLVSSAGGAAIRFCDGLDVDSNTGLVYFTDASSRYVLSNATQAILNGDRTGRLLSFNPRTGQVAVLARGLSGPGGVAVAKDSSYLLITEFVGGTVKKFFLTGPSANRIQTLLNNVPIASKIKRTVEGEFTFTETVAPFTHRALRINGDGTVLANVSLGGPYNNVSVVTGVQIFRGFTYVASLDANFIDPVSELGLA
ncbi:protein STRICTOSIDINE SYNTHASE-LIKE 12-like [Rhodamnia argentea]|uniref:Protein STRICTOSIDINE SYNTHASE-LIKE 12-like n=1 Tax=Rhodamnia argentea TaxID=178133 RepID=A0ABM3HHF5_9MYRT|nr:protein STRICTOSIDINE SYNTHASE-LIKE 12-like [Rhodamnia argentea]